MGRISKETEQLMHALAQLFNSSVVSVQKRACTGKFRGTVDYSLLFSNNRELFISNGMKYFKENIHDKVCLYNNFNTNKEVILRKLQEVVEIDREIAKYKGLSSYELIDVDYAKEGTYIGWFYILIKVNGRLIKHIETNLASYIRKLCLDTSTGTEYLIRSKYFVAGGETGADYVLAGVGFNSNSSLYTL